MTLPRLVKEINKSPFTQLELKRIFHDVFRNGETYERYMRFSEYLGDEISKPYTISKLTHYGDFLEDLDTLKMDIYTICRMFKPMPQSRSEAMQSSGTKAMQSSGTKAMQSSGTKAMQPTEQNFIIMYSGAFHSRTIAG